MVKLIKRRVVEGLKPETRRKINLELRGTGIKFVTHEKFMELKERKERRLLKKFPK